MKKITIIQFNPQDREDTVNAIYFHKNNTEDTEIYLEPSSNLMHTECLSVLSGYGYRFSPSLNKFYLPKK